MAERSEAKSAKRSFASKYFKFSFLTRSFASRFNFRFPNPCVYSGQIIVLFNLGKNGWAKRSKKREAKLRLKIFQILFFDAKLRFALFASLRSAIFTQIL